MTILVGNLSLLGITNAELVRRFTPVVAMVLINAKPADLVVLRGRDHESSISRTQTIANIPITIYEVQPSTMFVYSVSTVEVQLICLELNTAIAKD